jgi:hypothetical protein
MGSNLAMSDDTHDVMDGIPCSDPKRKKTKNSLTWYDAIDLIRWACFRLDRLKIADRIAIRAVCLDSLWWKHG